MIYLLEQLPGHTSVSIDSPLHSVLTFEMEIQARVRDFLFTPSKSQMQVDHVVHSFQTMFKK